MNNLRELFENEYPGKKVIYEQIIKLIFDKAKNTTLTNNQILTNSEKSQINSLSIIAQVRGGFPITFADVELKDSVILNRSRVSIQNCVRRILENDSNAIIFFHFADNKKEWRVSYVYRGDTAKDSTNAKRYTYICGKEHACRTIAERFDTLQGLEHITEKELLTAFSVEALSSEFFDKYREIYADFVEYISGKRYIKQSGKFVEKKTKNANPQFKTQFNNDEKSVRDYVKKMLGRIVFLYFLQKKGWLGDSVENGKWGFGDKNFMGNLFNNSCNKDDFLEKVLEPLFFQTLNSPRENNIAPSAVCKEYGSKIKIPYLNGGLFEKDELDIKQIKFKKEMFEKLFTLFSQYNFTIDETDSDDIEVGVDPEMLGKIFENLLEDNKDKGAFYTPKEIVQYMCRESLIAYLLTDSKIQEEKIRTLVTEHTDPAFTENEKSEIKTKLDNVKICDPAVGSGAFPMGMMNELIACHSVICKEDFDRAAIKKQIVQNNIYGVDIEKGAVDIARLRFWLAIIVDEKEPIPLPNLDYKIMQGNSLLESIEGIDLSHLTESAKGELFDDAETLNNLKDALKGFYVPDSSIAKDKIRNQIKEYVITLMKERQLAPAAISKLSAKDYKLHENSDFFLWHTWFNDVFNRSFDKGNSAPGGFDIVIGNPPYGANIDNLVKTYEKIYPETSHGFKDIYKYFFDKAFKLICNNGCVCFITPNTFFRQPRYGDLRRVLLKNNIIQLIDLGEDVFEAVVPTAISLLSKKGNKNVAFVDLTKQNNVTLNFAKTPFKQIEQTLFETTPNNIFIENIRQKTENEFLLDEILDFKDAGINYQRVNVGLSEKGKSDLSKRLLYEGQKENINDIEYWKGTDISSYEKSVSTHRYCRPNIALQPNERVMLNKDYFSINPKLIWRQTAPFFIGTIDYEGVWFGRSIQAGIIKPEFRDKVSYEYLLGLLNSKYLRYLYEQNVKEEGRVFPQVKLEKLRPLPIIISEQLQPIITLVEKILAAHASTSSATATKDTTTATAVGEPVEPNTTALEAKIDQLVYKLYGLTDEEIKVIEGKQR